MDPLDGAREKWERACEHLETLDHETTTFVRDHPYRIVGKLYSKTRHKTFRIVQPEPAPLRRWGVIVGDTLHNLNSALDHVAWQFALRKRRNPTRSTAFPVCVRDGQWDERGTKDMLRHIDAEDRAFIQRKQPYPAPDGHRPETHAFAMLRTLARIDKHRVLHTAFLLPMDTDIELFGMRDLMRPPRVDLFINNPLKQGAKFARAFLEPSGPNPDVQMNVKLSLYVAFVGREYGWMNRGMVFYVLRAIRNEVRKTIDEAAATF